MSADNPPTYYFTGIQFNSAFYNGNDPLTQTDATSLYLLKNTPDTATALETFSGGIKTNSILPTTTTGLLVVGTASTFTDLKGAVKASNTFQTPAIDPVLGGGNFDIGCGTISTINVGTASASAINIGGNTITTNMYGFNNIARNTTGTKNTYIETFSTTTANTIDFHSSGAFDTDYDSRITTSGGTSANGLGTINITANTLTLTTPTINANGNLIMGTGRNITLQPVTGFATPTSGTMLGGLTQGSAFTTAVITASPQTLSTLTLTAGVYVVTFKVSISWTTSPSTIGYTLNSVTYGSTFVPGSTTSGGTVGTAILSGGTYPLNFVSNLGINTACVPANCFFTAVRIA